MPEVKEAVVTGEDVYGVNDIYNEFLGDLFKRLEELKHFKNFS